MVPLGHTRCISLQRFGACDVDALCQNSQIHATRDYIRITHAKKRRHRDVVGLAVDCSEVLDIGKVELVDDGELELDWKSGPGRLRTRVGEHGESP